MKTNFDDIKIYNSKKAFDTLEVVKKRPEGFLSNKTISALQDFINGYMHGNPYPDDDPPFAEFAMFLVEETNFDMGGTGKLNLIAKVLLHVCEGDEVKAYNKFFEYLEVYKSKPIV